MAIHSDENVLLAAARDALIYGTGATMRSIFIPLHHFFDLPEPGERNPWDGYFVWFDQEPYDDGGGPALAAYRFARCR